MGSRTMEPLETRITGIIALILVLAMLGSSVILMKIADSSSHAHCNMHGQTITCVSEAGRTA
jgi:hypothetical protein